MNPYSLLRCASALFALPLLAIGLAPAAQAEAIIVQNFTFETPAQPVDGYAYVVPNWTVGGGRASTYRPGPGIFTDPVPDGLQVVALDIDASIAQQLGESLQANATYTLSTGVGSRNAYPGFGGGIELYVGGTVTNGVVTGGTLLGSTIVSPALGTFQTGTVTYNSTSASPGLGQFLSVRLSYGGGNQLSFDNVQLDRVGGAETPEPGSVALLIGSVLSGSVSIFRRRRIRK